MDKTEKAKEVYKKLEAKYGIRKVGGDHDDDEDDGGYGFRSECYEMDPEKVSESLGVKVVKASFKSVDQLETALPDGKNLPMLSFSNFVIHVDDQSMSEKGLVPKFSVESDEDIIVIIDNFELYEAESGTGVNISFLHTSWSGSGQTKSISKLSFVGFTLVTPENHEEYTIDCKKIAFGSFSLAQFPQESDSLKTAESKTFVEFVMGALGMGPRNLLSVFPEVKMEDARFPLNLCGIDHVITVKRVLVDREKGHIVLRNPRISGSEVDIAGKLTISVDKDTYNISITSEGGLAINYERVYELWKILDEHLESVGKTANFTFEGAQSDKKGSVVTLPNGAFAEISGLRVETKLGAGRATVVKISFSRALVKRAVGDRTKLVVVATHSERPGDWQSPCITLSTNTKKDEEEEEEHSSPKTLSEREFNFLGDSDSNAEKFEKTCRGCRHIVRVDLTTLSVQTLGELRSIFREMLHFESGAATFTILVVRKSLLLYMDPTRYITSKNPTVVYARSSPGAAGAYLACLSDLSLYVSSPANPEQYVAAFHSVPVKVSRRIPVEVYSDSESLFVAAEGTALLACPETLEKVFESSEITGKRHIVAKLAASSVKLSNRIRAMKTLISAAVVSAKTITITSEKPFESGIESDSALNVQSKVNLEMTAAELYTVGLLDNMVFPRTKACGNGRSGATDDAVCSTPSDFWSSLGFLRFGAFSSMLVTVILAAPMHCSLGVSVDRVDGLEMDFYPDTLFPLLDIFRCLMTQAKELVERWKLKYPQQSIADTPPPRLQSTRLFGSTSAILGTSIGKSMSPPKVAPPPPGSVFQRQQASVAMGYYMQQQSRASFDRKPSPGKQASLPAEKKAFRMISEFSPCPDYHDSSMTGMTDSTDEDAFMEDLKYTEIAIRVKEIGEFTLRFKSQPAMQGNAGGRSPHYKGSESKVLSSGEAIPNNADIYYRSKLLPKEAYWFGNIDLGAPSKTRQPVVAATSSSQLEGDSKSGEDNDDHMLEVTVRGGYFSYTFINDKLLKDAPAKKRVYMWFNTFTAKYDGKVIGESRGDRFRRSYIPGPASPYVTFFLSFVVPNKVNGGEEDMDDDGNLSIYINPCYVSFMQNVFAMFDKYAVHKSPNLLSETPFSKSITRITLHPFVLNFDWVALNGYVSFKNVVTETQFISFKPTRHSWGSVLPEIIHHMRSKYIVGLLSDSFATGADNPICSVARIFRCAKDVAVRPVHEASQGARNVFMGIIEGAWELTCTVFEESKNVGTMACKGFYTLCQKGFNYYSGNNDNGAKGSEGGKEGGNNGANDGPCTDLFMSLPFGVQGK